MKHSGIILLRFVTGLLISLVAIASGYIGYMYFSEFKPAPKEVLYAEPGKRTDTLSQKLFHIMTWNIGYAGLDRDMDFFYDGGKKVRPDRQSFDSALHYILSFSGKIDTLDFILLQEVDTFARRSYYVNEFRLLQEQLKGFSAFFARNYDVKFVPVPITEPMGRVVSGMAFFSRVKPMDVIRNAYDFHFPFFTRLAMLKRCFIEARYPLAGGKELVILTLHNSVFDKDGIIRKQELRFLSSFMAVEYEKGNFIVAGGDWNSNPKGFNPALITTSDRVGVYEPAIDSTLFSGWNYVFDPYTPTNRNVDVPYRKGHTSTTILDFFLVSPNIRVLSVATLNLEFAYSDHHPVFMTFELNHE